VSDKFKEEFRTTVQYYEGVIENLMKENRQYKKQSGFDMDHKHDLHEKL
jgi:hypothetical protein